MRLVTLIFATTLFFSSIGKADYFFCENFEVNSEFQSSFYMYEPYNYFFKYEENAKKINILRFLPFHKNTMSVIEKDDEMFDRFVKSLNNKSYSMTDFHLLFRPETFNINIVYKSPFEIMGTTSINQLALNDFRIKEFKLNLINGRGFFEDPALYGIDGIDCKIVSQNILGESLDNIINFYNKKN